MTWLDEIDPDINHFIDEMRKDWSRYPDAASLSWPEMRDVAEKVRARWAACGPRLAETHEFTFDPGGGELRLRIYRPVISDAPLPAMIYIHGGGFSLFNIETHDRLMREYADKGNFAVIGIDYPLAPEAKYPEALNRIEALMLWLGANAEKWNIDPARLALAGDSAGGNLSFAAFQRLRKTGKERTVKAILSNYGGFSPHISDESEARFGGPGSIMDREEAQQYWANYLRGPKDEDDPEACPILADLADFPPVMLVVPELDLVAEDSFRMHERLQSAGVRVICNTYSGAVHSFLEAMSISDIAQQGISDGAEFIVRHIARKTG